MCIAIVKPSGAWVSKDHLQNSFRANPHGAGYAYFDPTSQTVKIRKGFFSFRKFWRAYISEVSSEHTALVHFRIATAGKTDEANCHPFAIKSGALMHNGPRLNYRHCNGDAERSDTRQFAEDMVGTFTRDQIAGISGMIQEFIGTEKIAFLFTTGEYMIVNEKMGMWDGPKDEQCWYSNSSFRGLINTYSGKTERGTGSSPSTTVWQPAHGGSGYTGSAGNYTGGMGNYTGLDDEDYEGWWDRRRDAQKLAGTLEPGKTGAGADPAYDVLGFEREGSLAVIERFGTGGAKTLVPTRWSNQFGLFLPSHIISDGIRLYWSEGLRGYAPPLKDGHEFIEDGDLIYMIKEGAEGNISLHDVVSEVIRDTDHLREFVASCRDYNTKVKLTLVDKNTSTESGGSIEGTTDTANTDLVVVAGDQ